MDSGNTFFSSETYGWELEISNYPKAHNNNENDYNCFISEKYLTPLEHFWCWMFLIFKN